MERLTFPDLAPADRDLTAEEHAWLGALARDTDPTLFTVNLGPSAAADDSGPVVACDQYGTWRAGRYIGELYRDGRVIEIRPRLGIETIAHWAGAAMNVRITPRSGEHTGSQMLIAELLAAAWRSALVDAGYDSLKRPRLDG